MMLSKTTLRKWYHQLPQPIIDFVRRQRNLPQPNSLVHTDASWLQNCQETLHNLHGSKGDIGQGRCQISWPAVNSEKANLKASVRTNPSSDLLVFCQVWEAQQYRAVVDYMQPWVVPGKPLRIIDAGANVGFTTLYLKSCFPSAHIISLEPDESNYAQLVENVTQNELPDVTMLKAGLWKGQASLEVGRDVGDQREWSFYVKEAAGPTDLQGYDVQYLMQQAGWEQIDLLKIDIEGAERYLFGDNETAEKTLRSARFLAIEIHDNFRIRPRIYNCLDKYGFEYFDAGELTIGRNKNLVP